LGDQLTKFLETWSFC